MLLPWEDHLASLDGAGDGLDVAVWTDDGPEPAQEVLDDVVLYVPAYQGGRRALEAARRMPRLRTIQCLWAGVDSFWPFVPEGVPLHNAAGVHDTSTAELALALMLARLRRLDDFARQPGTWVHVETPALADRRVLIVGYGSIGKAIEQRLAGFEVDVVRVARTARTSAVRAAVSTTAPRATLTSSAPSFIRARNAASTSPLVSAVSSGCRPGRAASRARRDPRGRARGLR